MKKNWIYPLLALALLFAAGCQKTPEEAIVKGKSSEDLLQKAAAETGGTLAERLNAPERYEASFSNVGGELQVTVDAAVTVPDAEAVPIIRVRPANITQAQVDALMDKLVQGTLYEFGTPETKAEIADKIVAAKQQLAEGPSEEDAGTTYVSEDGPMTYEEYMQYVIDILMEQYEAAPETAEKTVSTGQLSALADDMMSAGGHHVVGEGAELARGHRLLRGLRGGLVLLHEDVDDVLHILLIGHRAVLGDVRRPRVLLRGPFGQLLLGGHDLVGDLRLRLRRAELVERALDQLIHERVHLCLGDVGGPDPDDRHGLRVRDGDGRVHGHLKLPAHVGEGGLIPLRGIQPLGQCPACLRRRLLEKVFAALALDDGLLRGFLAPGGKKQRQGQQRIYPVFLHAFASVSVMDPLCWAGGRKTIIKIFFFSYYFLIPAG